MTTRRHVLLSALGSVALEPSSGTVFASETKRVRIVVGFPAGGSVDLVARLFGKSISSALGEAVFVENRPGASGRLAILSVKEAAADGLTLLASPGAVFTLYPHMLRNLRYDPFKDFVPIAKLVAWDLALAVPTDSAATTFAEFVEIARGDPEKAFYASPSAGSPLHFLGLELGRKIGVALQHVAFKGGRDAVTALAGGQVPAALLNLGDLMELHRAGRVRILTIFSATRSPVLPEVPTIGEVGYPELVSDGWVAMYARTGTPQRAVQRLQLAINSAVREPEVKNAITTAGGRAEVLTTPALEALSQQEFARWREVVKKSGYRED
jgi:tripartite-type tricarboxylate transporter receptor subunit TctC